jgi:hypothetical protein
MSEMKPAECIQRLMALGHIQPEYMRGGFVGYKDRTGAIFACDEEILDWFPKEMYAR